MTTPQNIGRYQVLESAGTGGFATVYRAQDPQLDRVIALKVLHPHMAGNPQYLERFVREARLAASINHPNVVTIYEVGQEANSHFIAMEYLPASLEGQLPQGGLPISQALELTRQIALGLQAAHQQGVVHRDLKPANILLTPDGTPKVTDFGIARAAELSNMTASGTVLGTPNYMSPEQAQGHSVDARSDIYSLGCVLFQMLTGALPFESTTSWEVIRQHIEAAPRLIRQLNADIPASVEQLVSRCLAKDPNQRFQSAQELAQAIARLMGTMPQTPFQPAAGAVPSAGATIVSTPGGGPALAQPSGSRRRGKPWMLAAAGVIALLAVVGALVGVAAFRSGNGGENTSSAGAAAAAAVPPTGKNAVAIPTATASLTLAPQGPTAAPIPTLTSTSVPTLALSPGRTPVPTPRLRASSTVVPTATPLAPTQSFKVEFVAKWGSEGTGNGQFRSARGIAIDTSGNVYVSDNNNNRIQKFNAQGAFLTKWGSHGRGPGQFAGPYYLAIDQSGSVLVADNGNQRVQKFSSQGMYLDEWSVEGSGAIGGIAVGKSGNVYILAAGSRQVRKYTANGVLLVQWKGPWAVNNSPTAIALDEMENVYITSWLGQVHKFDSNGRLLLEWGSRGTGEGQFITPLGITIYDGKVYVLDSGNLRVQRFTPAGEFEAIPILSSQGEGNNQFQVPKGLIFGPTGNIFILDETNVQMFRRVSIR